MFRLTAIAVLLSGILCTTAAAQVSDLEQQWLASDAPQREQIARVPARFGKGWNLRSAPTPVIVAPAVTFPYSFSLETWFRLEDTTGRSALLSSSATQRFVVSIANGSYVEASFYDRGSTPELTHHRFGYDFVPGNWYHLVITVDGGNSISFYINGRLAHRLPPFSKERRKSDFDLHAIGAFSIDGKAYHHFFKGTIDRTVFAARAWSDSEIDARYAEAVRTLPISPIPAQVSFVGESLPKSGRALELRLSTTLLTESDRSIVRLTDALKNSRIGGSVVLSDAHSADLPAHVRERLEGDLPAEGYLLSVRPNRIDIVAGDPRGLSFGADTLRQLLALGDVPQVDIYDYPEFAFRAGLMVTNNKPPASLSDGFGGVSLRQTIEEMADYRMNAIVIRIYNWSWLDDPENLAKAKEIVEYAKKHHLEVIPYLQCYGHAKMFTWRDARTDHTRTIAEEQVVLTGDQPAELKTPNVIITANTPILVHLPDGTAMVEGRDFEVVPGEVKMSWVPPEGVKVKHATWGRPYIHPDSRPFAIRRLNGGRIADGTAVKVTYDVASNSREYCPFSPVTHELVNDTLRRVIELADPSYIHLGMDELWTPVSREGRCCAEANSTGMSRAEVFRREINRTYAVAQQIKPGIRVMYWSDMLDPNQSPEWMRTWDAIDAELLKIDRGIVLMPWYYEGHTTRLWQAGDSMDRFRRQGFSTIGASGHDVLNQFIWSNATRTRYDATLSPGFTMTTWASRSGVDELIRGYRAYAQASWSPSRTPFHALLQLRLELNELGITPAVPDEQWPDVTARIAPVQRERLARLLATARMEEASVDRETLAKARIPGVEEMLLAIEQADRLLK